MKKQTALQQFIEWGNQMIGDHPAKTLSFYEAIDKAEELLEVEKEQIVDAYKHNSMIRTISKAEQYYNETYNTDTQ
jgi:hypothetical protein